MKKRSVTKLLSCVLAISMVVTAAPMAAWASEVPAAAEESSEEVPDEVEEEKKEDAEVTEDVGNQEAPQETEDVAGEDAPQAEGEGQEEAPEALAPAEEDAVPEVGKAAGRSVAIDGKLDAWAQDPQTVIGDDAVNEMYNNAYRHFVAGSGNGNDVKDSAKYPAMFVNPASFDFTKAGYFEYEIFPGTTPANTRFGVYLDYKDPAHGIFLGYDSGGWYWQNYNGEDNPYGSSGVAGPAQGVWAKVKIEWTAEGVFSLTVNGSKIIDNVKSSAELSQEGKIAVKCAAYGGNVTNVYLNNIFYEGQAEVEGNHITGKVVDEAGAPVAGVKLETGRYSAETAADGTYDLEVLDGTHNISVTKKGYISESVRIKVDGANVAADDIVICSQTEFETMDLNTADMKVVVAKNFPSIVKYEMKKGDLAGKTFYGQVNRLVNIKINGVSCKVTKDNLKATFTDTAATYEMALKGENIDCVITAVISVKDNTASFDITKVENNLKDLDDNGYQLYPVQTIEVPDHSLISVNSTQEKAHLKGAKMSSNTRISGDRDFDVTKGVRLTNGAASEDFIYGFISNNEMSAGLWSNSEYQGTHVASYIASGGASNTRVLATVTDTEDASTLGLASTQWYYDRKVSTNVVVDRVAVDGKNQNTTEQRTYVVGHEIMPSAKVVIAGDVNGDKDIDWQDGAVAFRSIMHNPYKSEEVPELVNYRIAMNFGSMAANPFLMNLDGVKRVYLNTEGLGQGVLLKGYGSEGHDSGHPDYGDIGRRIGGADDMNRLLVEGKKMGALFGVHVNASEMYTEAKAFSNELSQGNFGWNWLDQGIGINSRYDLATGAREARFKELYNQVGNNLDFIYVDVWGNHTSGAENEDAWATRMLFREISGLGWRVATEWGPTGEYDSTLQHWAADLSYGGNAAKGENSEVMRFLRNHQKDSWIADYPRYGGAAQSPLLGGLNMTDFEGWQGRTNYKDYINVMFRHNLITKYLQHYQVVDWVDGDAVQLPTGESWTPEMQITLRNTKDTADDTELVVSRKSNDYSKLAEYRSRTIKLNGVTISEGAPTGGDGSNPGDEKYLIPWNWDCNGKKLAADDLKMYHWNTKGGTSTWTLTKDWQGLSSVVVYKLTDAGRTDKKVVNVVNNTITLEDMEAETPYVVFKGEKAPLAVDWQTSKYVYDMGFNDQDVESHRTVSGEGTADIAENASANHMLKLEGEVSVSTKLTNLRKGQKYALYVGVDNRSDSKAHATVTAAGGKVLGTNYTERSYAYNWVKSDQHNAYAHTENKGDYSYFQNMYVFFTAEGSTATLTFKREAGKGATYFDDIRIVETKMDVAVETNEDGIITSLYNDFEENAQGIWPFVVGGAEGVEDNRVHLSERHDPFTSAGYISKSVDDVLDGNWSLKVNGLSQRNSIVYQTIPQNFHFQPGETYYVSFDYQMGSNRVYEVRLGDGEDDNVRSWALAGTPGKTKRYGFSFTASESGQNWFGIYSTGIAPETGGYSGNMLDFSGYKDFVLDNVRIEKGVLDIDKTYEERDSAEEPIQLHAEFIDRWVSPGTKITWKSSDESVARVDDDGTVYFVGFGTAVISANATVDGIDYSASCVVHLNDGYEKTAASNGVWANTEAPEEGGSNGVKGAVADGSASTFWHSKWSGTAFVVSESNPAIITVKFEDDASEYDIKSFQQRPSGSNGIVQEYECIIGDEFDPATNTITGDKFTTGKKTTKNEAASAGKTEILDVSKDVKGHYIQIRVYKGSGNFASLAEIWMQTRISYDTPEERAFMAANAEIFAPKDLAAAKDQLTSAISNAQDVYSAGESLYSSATWTAFAEAYEAAKQAEKTGTLQEIKDTKAALEAAQDNLKLLSETGKELDNAKKALKAAIEQVKPAYEAGRGDYSTESWEAFEDAYTEAKLGLDSESISKVNRLATALLAARDGLKTPDEVVPSDDEKEIVAARKKVNDAIKAAEAVKRGDYSDETWEAFEEALVAARAGADSASVTKLNRLEKALKDAQAALKKAETPEPSETEKQLEAARTALNTAITAAKAVYDAGKKDYSDATWEAFETAYNEAKAGVDSGSKAQLDRLASTLTAAQNNLKPADKQEPSEAEKQLEAARTALNAAITAAKAVYDAGQKDYSNTSWEAFESAYNEAKAGADSGSKAQLDRLKAALTSAQDGLKGEEEPSEDEKKLQEAKKSLKAVLDAAEKTYEAGKKNFTDTSWEEFEAYYIRATRAYQTTASYSKMNRYAKDLANAQKGLENNAKVGDTFTVKKVNYKVTSVSKRTVAVVKGTDKNATSASIASTVEFRDVTFKVTSISAKAFKGFKKLKKVTIGAYVQSIKSEAFAGCTSLAQVSIGKRVSTIDKKAFYGCKKLKTVVFLGTAIKSVKTQAFKGTSASMKVTLPKKASTKKRASVKNMMVKAGMSKKAAVR